MARFGTAQGGARLNALPKRDGPSGFQMPLPRGMVESEGFAEHINKYKSDLLVLQTLANTANHKHIMPDGSIVGCLGGKKTMAACPVHPATFWRSIKRLCEVGYLVPLSRGGPWEGFTGRIKNLSNSYGIPGHPGALDQKAVKRAKHRYVKDATGNLRRIVDEPGAQATLWPVYDLQPADDVGGTRTTRVGYSHDAGGVLAPSGCGTRTMRVCSNTDSNTNSRPYRSHEAGGDSGEVEQTTAAKCPTIPKAMFYSMDLARTSWSEACRMGVADPSEHGWHTWVGMLCHCWRVGDEPTRLFAGNVRRQNWKVIQPCDDEAARNAINKWRGER